ncbi:hypothetical protein MBM_06525 [Drepanopeziza brunnea f. sp. 'multigermtubi' MB_m1]|uniref:Uncharacterized protein n=1 Tax=Marssonina brunnea f. sp. multigermtubi (strain MB_m1) TaxID=1072389 RepID=K1XRT3_MARBU|nr:uncharacterized protein MBM_06525 [Drepanopeziza brunnea f. sp. 'multigermtubi' MB_m1]EKD15309.1 hypothetical protein MBM_06525 [Drepanopeziza brunnea f. sp. 'multigermtubi' MB_m1]
MRPRLHPSADTSTTCGTRRPRGPEPQPATSRAASAWALGWAGWQAGLPMDAGAIPVDGPRDPEVAVEDDAGGDVPGGGGSSRDGAGPLDEQGGGEPGVRPAGLLVVAGGWLRRAAEPGGVRPLPGC